MNDKDIPWNVKVVFTLPTQPYTAWAPMDPVEVKLENMTSYTEALILINRIKNKND
jgi:hypothetical protein